VLSRPKGRAKSEVAGHIGIGEAFGPVRFDGWDANGQPVGKPVTSPLMKCLATEESQAGNTFENIAFIAASGVRTLTPRSTAASLGSGSTSRRPPCTCRMAARSGLAPPGRRRRTAARKRGCVRMSRTSTCSASSRHVRDGRRNLGKRKLAEPWMLQTSTAYRPGEQSIFEETLTAWRKGELSESVLVDHREAKGKIDIATRRTRCAAPPGLRRRVGVDGLDRIYREMLDPRSCPDVETAARYYLNRAHESAKDAWIAKDVHERQILAALARR
jgi:hypothetical protein